MDAEPETGSFARRTLEFWFLCFAALAVMVAGSLLAARPARVAPPGADADRAGLHWIGTWATAPQRAFPHRVETFRDQTLRLIVHTSAGGRKVRIRISNTFGSRPLVIGAAHAARRSAGADIDPSSDRAVTFGGRASTTIPAGSTALSDPADLDVPALSDLAISLFFPEETPATTSHALALQTSYVSAVTGNETAKASLPGAKPISSWPFLTGADVAASPRAAAIVAFGSSLTDGDGSTKDVNRRWPDVLAERLQKAGRPERGVLNEGIIGNRLLTDFDSPRQGGGPFADVLAKLGPGLGAAGVARFERDVLDQAGVRWVILGLGVTDILFPGSFIPVSESVDARSLIAANRQLVARTRAKGMKAIGTTIPPFENATFRNPTISFSTPEKEAVRLEVNEWLRNGGGFDAVIDFDAAVRDPSHPARILPAYDSGDHLHPNDAGYLASGNAIPLALFRDR
jgi:lysophospholipase L1-like esterase